ncbi:type 1 glutamine amidotransferase-like domain-containing protein [Gordonia desulfuricans]|uniref:Type 1 glutamine amidotransferase-like domain-containing protein n=1 Tax=Gordonia desulfuricans TaxID=89051 RepID=A0A7K3LWA1_9ACTN|nr:Type 1 glutamine amidotransferase-like domain-containing protein [Gordonia desulfuricans]NDK92221.1 type 1 glutamine amidotransferase-like domain-containing protein [Gordonia desulfuricans]
MNLLLLSLGFGAAHDFLTVATGRAPEALTIGYLGDAQIPYADAPWVHSERARLAELGCAVVDVSAAELGLDAFTATLDTADAVYVSGGNTYALLWALRRAGAADVLAERVRAGLPYIGCSAGSVIVGPSIAPIGDMDDPAEAPGPVDPRGLGLIDHVVIPHADGQLPWYPPERIDRVRTEFGDRFALDFVGDEQAVLVRDGRTTTIVSGF